MRDSTPAVFAEPFGSCIDKVERSSCVRNLEVKMQISCLAGILLSKNTWIDPE